MAERTERAVQREERDTNAVSCVMVICDGRQSSTDRHDHETPRQPKWKCKLKSLFLGLGFACVITCFVFASLGYMKLRNCPSNIKCEQNSAKFSEAQNFRLAAAFLFIVATHKSGKMPFMDNTSKP